MTVMRTIKLGTGAVLAFVLAACGSTVEPGSSGGGQSGSSSSSSNGGSSGTGSGAQCGGFIGAVCPAGEFCDYVDGLCGTADGAGVCVKRPEACTKELSPSCACDGNVYDNPCAASSAGFDLANQNCTAPSGSFGCGAQFCQSNKEYCLRTTSDVGETDGYKCSPLPSICGGKQDCACVAGEPCGKVCEAKPGGGVQVTCLGG